MKLRYFAWVRERVGLAEETVDLPRDVSTMADLVQWLRSRGENYAYAFENSGAIRASIDRTHVKGDAPLAGATEIGFFPPMTGG